MESALVVLALLACQLLMLAMGGSARVRGDAAGSKEAGRESDRLAARP